MRSVALSLAILLLASAAWGAEPDPEVRLALGALLGFEIQPKPYPMTRVGYGDNGVGPCGGYCNDIRPEYRKPCPSNRRPGYDEDGWCECIVWDNQCQ